MEVMALSLLGLHPHFLLYMLSSIAVGCPSLLPKDIVLCNHLHSPQGPRPLWPCRLSLTKAH